MSLYESWPRFPKVLDAKNWEKERGVLSKIFKQDTGIGKKLRGAEDAFDKIQAAYFSEVAVDVSTKAACAQALKNIQTEFNGPVKTCMNALLEVRQLAEEKAREFKNHPLIPKSSRQYVERIADAAQEFSDVIRQHILNAQKDIKKAASTAT